MAERDRSATHDEQRREFGAGRLVGVRAAS
jgi:hypothetical protein